MRPVPQDEACPTGNLSERLISLRGPSFPVCPSSYPYSLLLLQLPFLRGVFLFCQQTCPVTPLTNSTLAPFTKISAVMEIFLELTLLEDPRPVWRVALDQQRILPRMLTPGATAALCLNCLVASGCRSLVKDDVDWQRHHQN